MGEQGEDQEPGTRLAAIKSFSAPIRGYMFDLLKDFRLSKADRSLLTRFMVEDGAMWERLKAEANSDANVHRIERKQRQTAH